MDDTGMSKRAQATQAGFFNAIAGEAAPEDLQEPGHGEPAHPYFEDDNYRHGYEIGEWVRGNYARYAERRHQIENR